MAARGWAWTAYDWDEGRLFNYIGDAQNTFPVWNATPLIALDVYEHAYFLDYQTDRASYIDAFFDNLEWSVVNDWVVQVPDSRRDRHRARTLVGYLAGSIPSGTGSSARSRAPTSAARQRQHRRDERLAHVRAARTACPSSSSTLRRGSCPAFVFSTGLAARGRARRRCRDGRARAPAVPAFREGREDGRDDGRRVPRRRSARRRRRRGRVARRLPRDALRVGRVDARRALAARRGVRCSASRGR